MYVLFLANSLSASVFIIPNLCRMFYDFLFMSIFSFIFDTEVSFLPGANESNTYFIILIGRVLPNLSCSLFVDINFSSSAALLINCCVSFITFFNSGLLISFPLNLVSDISLENLHNLSFNASLNSFSSCSFFISEYENWYSAGVTALRKFLIIAKTAFSDSFTGCWSNLLFIEDNSLFCSISLLYIVGFSLAFLKCFFIFSLLLLM